MVISRGTPVSTQRNSGSSMMPDAPGGTCSPMPLVQASCAAKLNQPGATAKMAIVMSTATITLKTTVKMSATSHATGLEGNASTLASACSCGFVKNTASPN